MARLTNGGIIGKQVTTPTTSAASGKWNLSEQNIYKISNTWPASYVTSGLMFELDAANSSSYPGSGSTWYDISGANRNVTLSGVSFSSNNGGYLIFDGSSSIGTMNSIGSQSTYTIETWFRPTSVPSNNGCVISDIYPSYVNFKIGFNASGGMTGGTYIPGWYDTPAKTMTANTWYNLTMVCTGTNGQIILYDSATSLGGTNISGTPQTSGSGIRIGRRWDNPDYFPGHISIIRFYNRALSQSEIQQNFNSFRGRYGI